MAGDRPKRPGRHQTSTERDLESLTRRYATPVPGLTLPEDLPAFDATPEEFDAFTPVTDVLALCRGNAQLEAAIQRTWAHTRNLEMRIGKRLEERDVDHLAKRMAELELQVVDLHGESGSNGKLGNLRTVVDDNTKKVNIILSRAWWAFTVIVGGIGAAAVKLVLVGKAYGELETTVQSLKAQGDRQAAEILLLRQSRRLLFSPAEEPGKESLP